MDDHMPDTSPQGALVPPPRVPPTAVASSAPLPPVPPRDPQLREIRLSAVINSVLDELDQIGDRIATAAGLR